MDYNYYQQQSRDSYDYQQQIVTPIFTHDISGLTLDNLMIYILDHLFWDMSNNHILSVYLSNHMFQTVFNNNMYHHSKLKQPMDHPTGKL